MLDPNPYLRINSEQALNHKYFKEDGAIIKDLIKINHHFMASKITSKTKSNKLTSVDPNLLRTKSKHNKIQGQDSFQFYKSRRHLQLLVDPE